MTRSPSQDREFAGGQEPVRNCTFTATIESGYPGSEAGIQEIGLMRVTGLRKSPPVRDGGEPVPGCITLVRKVEPGNTILRDWQETGDARAVTITVAGTLQFVQTGCEPGDLYFIDLDAGDNKVFTETLLVRNARMDFSHLGSTAG